MPRAGLVASTSEERTLSRAQVGPDSPHRARTTATTQDRWLVILGGGRYETPVACRASAAWRSNWVNTRDNRESPKPEPDQPACRGAPAWVDVPGRGCSHDGED